MLFILPLLACITAVQGLTIPRDAAPVLSSLDTITGQLHSLGGLVQKFSGGGNGTLAALEIQGKTGDLKTTVDNGTTAIKKIEPLDEGDSSKVVNVVVELQSDIYDLLDLLVDKKPAFDTAILGVGSASFLVKIDLEGLQKSTGQLGEAITSKLVEELKRLAPLVTSDIDFHFAQAIKAFS
ncbi:hypothetical protein ASPVEDRAFT_87347 [Aspergillus versicolor CBS 583.65]|uniref:Antigenic cell wall galactomannoprotein n=1 Tax=Aspergillus versicolor CBS 583.65 TaxID=1036611 RepID=A0A1L9PWW1_ASPVE|nr:uncharacterized protein ASPVEDRAFT_87347 [Aspergillus versicolor CBS 583.65]OJJ06024.1 hypothetical protein ASPVEDRAFT_87347 [Aspergillus versicolor CBS 583.65]